MCVRARAFNAAAAAPDQYFMALLSEQCEQVSKISALIYPK
jgi:hypothetical protein